MGEYDGALDKADEAVVFYSRHALELKRMPELPEAVVQKGFNKANLAVITNKQALDIWLKQRIFENANLVLMSSGNYDGLDMEHFSKTITTNTPVSLS